MHKRKDTMLLDERRSSATSLGRIVVNGRCWQLCPVVLGPAPAPMVPSKADNIPETLCKSGFDS